MVRLMRSIGSTKTIDNRDLVVRLRDATFYTFGGFQTRPDICAEAAAEIARLRGKLELQRKAGQCDAEFLIEVGGKPACGWGQTANRFRAALTEIAVQCERATHPAAPQCLTFAHVEHLKQIAAKAREVLA